MRLTLCQLQKVLPTNVRKWPKSSFRRPMQGRYTNRKKPFVSWDTTMGEIDEEEETPSGKMVPVRERIPVIMVPDLTDCNLKPYVSYRVEKFHEAAMTSKDLFDLLYAPTIEAEKAGLELESIPDPSAKPSILNRVKDIFISGERKKT